MSEIQITFRVNGDELSVIDAAGQKLGDFGASAQKASDGGLGSLIKGGADFYGTMQSVSSILGSGLGLIQQVNDLGTSAIRADMALNTMSGGQSAAYLDAMNTATGGLVANLDLSKDAAMALSTGLARTSDDMSHLAHDGAVLGVAFMGDAQSGIQAVENALEHVGQTRPLAALGLDIQAVKQEFERLKASGIDATTAWYKAFYDNADALTNKLEPALTSTGTAWEKLNKQKDDLLAHAGENVAIGIEATLDLVGAGWDVVSKLLAGPQTAPGLSGADAANIMADASKWTQYDTQSGDMSRFAGFNAGQGGTTTNSNRSSNYWAQNFYHPDNSDTSTDNTSSSNPSSSTLPSPADITAAKANLQALFNDANIAAQPLLNTVKEFNTVINTPHTTFASAFGTTGGSQITQSFTSQMQNDMSHLSKADQAKELEDVNSAYNKYRIATGEATTSSIAFDNARNKLSADVASGKITYDQEVTALTALSNAAKDGTGSMRDFNDELEKSGDPTLRAQGIAGNASLSVDATGHRGMTAGDVGKGGDKGAVSAADADAGVKGASNGQDPYAGVTTSAHIAQTAMQDMGTTSDQQMLRIAKSASKDPFTPLTVHAEGVGVSISRLAPAANDMATQLTAASNKADMSHTTTQVDAALQAVANYRSTLQSLPAMVAADVSIHITGTTSSGDGGGTKGHPQ